VRARYTEVTVMVHHRTLPHRNIDIATSHQLKRNIAWGGGDPDSHQSEGTGYGPGFLPGSVFIWWYTDVKFSSVPSKSPPAWLLSRNNASRDILKKHTENIVTSLRHSAQGEASSTPFTPFLDPTLVS